MTILKTLLKGNASFQSIYLRYSTKLPSKPRKKLAILTCTDTRLNPIRIFHINVGDAIILRNAGNQITDDAMRSLVTAIADGITEIIILGHTDCSLTKLSHQGVSRIIQDLGGSLGSILLNSFTEWLGSFSDEETNVRNQVIRLRSSSAIPSNVPIHGLLFNIIDGTLKVVVNGYEPHKKAKEISSTSISINMPALHMPNLSPRSILTPLKRDKQTSPNKLEIGVEYNE
ncbi:MAG: carbonic anhydrase [Candidatus Helarchaeota archaeon]|nr:carbonic anhydrase [Candidatus Helarchaeota archaeon]